MARHALLDQPTPTPSVHIRPPALNLTAVKSDQPPPRLRLANPDRHMVGHPTSAPTAPPPTPRLCPSPTDQQTNTLPTSISAKNPLCRCMYPRPGPSNPAVANYSARDISPMTRLAPLPPRLHRAPAYAHGIPPRYKQFPPAGTCRPISRRCPCPACPARSARHLPPPGRALSGPLAPPSKHDLAMTTAWLVLWHPPLAKA